jgi:hypothetical protein
MHAPTFFKAADDDDLRVRERYVNFHISAKKIETDSARESGKSEEEKQKTDDDREIRWIFFSDIAHCQGTTFARLFSETFPLLPF